MSSSLNGCKNVDKIWYLKRINIFLGLTESELREIDSLATMVRYKKRALIFFPGDPEDKIYILKAGRVKLSKLSSDGREATLDVIEPGEIFGEGALAGEGERETYAEALNDALICTMGRLDFERLLRWKPELSLRVTKLIGLRLRRIESRIEDLIFKNVPDRLAGLFLRLAEDYGTPHPRGVKIDLRITHQQLANLIGSTRETTSAAIGEFRRRGILDNENRRIIILDREGLEWMAGVV